ncbi:MAG: DUF433 domain-containing protein [Pseudonocardiales bacterium]|nr:DUF433 domain-containing protein [Pseudonocardiales bacterium]
MIAVDVLDREMYSEAEGARLLRVAQGTLHYWLEGGTQRGKTYKPIVRIEPTGARSVTWAEFVEAALLREYRRTHGVPMAELRQFIDLLRHHYGVPYPLAHHEPFVSGRQLVYEAQEGSGLAPEFCLVAAVSGQYVLTAPSPSYLERVTWTDDVAAAWRPHDDPRSLVLVNSEVRFGRPSVRGISTEVLWEHAEGGADTRELAEAFDLTVRDVQWALAYENAQRAA